MFFVVITVIGLLSARTGAGLVAWTVIATLSVLLHELGHAVVFRAFDRRPQIVLYGLGGATSAEAVSPWRSVLVSLAGPVTGLALGLAVWRLVPAPANSASLAASIRDSFLWINVAWGVFNLLPILPLDGGNVVLGVSRVVAGDRGDRFAFGISFLVAAAGGLVGLGLGQPFIAIFAAWLAAMNLNAFRAGSRPAALDDGWEALSRGDAAGAETAATSALRRPGSADKVRALELLAWSRLEAGRPRDAAGIIAGFPPDNQASALLRGVIELAEGHPSALDLAVPALAMENAPAEEAAAARIIRDSGRLPEVVARIFWLPPEQMRTAASAVQAGLFSGRAFIEAAWLGSDLYRRMPEASTALGVARSLAAAGYRGEAAAWIGRAMQDGADRTAIEGDPDLAGLVGLLAPGSSPLGSVALGSVAPGSAPPGDAPPGTAPPGTAPPAAAPPAAPGSHLQN
jgi:Zn-dependent protease